MANILCYGDSNTHGALPMTAQGGSDRAAPQDRWTEVLAQGLGPAHRVIPEGLPGRTTVHEDLVEGGARNGLAVLPAVLHSHKPLDLMVLMLGTNDLKQRFSVTALDIARSVERLVICAKTEIDLHNILVIAPAPVREIGTLAAAFVGAEARQAGLEAEIAAMAQRQQIGFLAAGAHVQVDPIDGVHWAPASQRHFGTVLVQEVLARL